MHSSSTISTLDADMEQWDVFSPVPYIFHIEDKVDLFVREWIVTAENSAEGFYFFGVGVSTKIYTH